MKESQIIVLDNFYEITEIAMCLFNRNGTINTFPHSDEPFINQVYLDFAINSFELNHRDINHPLILMIESLFFIGIIQLNNDDFLILGPVTTTNLNTEKVSNFLKDVILPSKLMEFIGLINKSTSYRKFSITISTVVKLLLDINIPIVDIILSNISEPKNVDISQYIEPDLPTQLQHTPMSFELGILSAVENGDLPLLKQKFLEPAPGNVGLMSNNPLSQEKYTFVSFITLVARAAIKGGVNPEIAFMMSDNYCLQMDSLSNLQNISILIYNMAVDFCEIVASKGHRQLYSQTTQKVCDYISTHLYENISMEVISTNVGQSIRNISLKFKNDVNMTIPNYIHKMKMNEASRLLKYSDYDIIDISNFLQYSSQSYFTQIFRKTYKITPQKYRDQK